MIANVLLIRLIGCSGALWQGQIPWTSTLGRSTSRDEYDPPSFQQATSHWSPPHSPTTSRPQSRHTSPNITPPSSSPPTSPRADSAVVSSPVPSTKEKLSLASQLYNASCAGDLQRINLLLSLGAPINAGTLVKGLYEAFKPAKHGHLSPLTGAAKHGQLSAVALLLSHGAHINPDVNASSSAPLHQACKSDDIRMVRFLLGQGADVNMQNCYKTTPLMYAVKYGSLELVSLVLSYSPDLETLSFIGTSAIHWVIFRNHQPHRLDTVELLLRAGANVDQRMSDESTPLHCAAMSGSADIAEVLLRYGADRKARNAEWKTPREVAVDNGYANVAELLTVGRR